MDKTRMIEFVTDTAARTLGQENRHIKVQPGWWNCITISILDKAVFVFLTHQTFSQMVLSITDTIQSQL